MKTTTEDTGETAGREASWTPPRRALVAGAALAAAAFALGGRAAGRQDAVPGSSAESAADAPRLVVLLRHAETGAGHGGDPALSEAGAARARALAALLAAAGPALLLASEYRRTADTLAPLAAALERDVERLSAREPAAWIARLDALPPGSLVVVCGHSNTVPDLVRRLGGELADLESGPAGLQFASAEHGRLVVCARSVAGPPAVFELRY